MRFLLLLAGFALAAQSPSLPYDESYGPLFVVTNVNKSRPSRARSIRDVDFRNRPAEIDGATFRLKGGKYEHMADEIFQSISLDAVHYPDNSHALVIYKIFEAGGSSNSNASAELFSLASGKLTKLQEIDWDTHSAGTAASYGFDTTKNTLVIRSSHYMPGDAHCCISAIDVVTFTWKADHFEQKSVLTEVSEYGRSQGKSTPATDVRPAPPL